MDKQDKIKKDNSWKTKGFDRFMSRGVNNEPDPASYISGSNFDILLDDLLFNRMIRFKGLDKTPQGNDPGKIYWDKDSKKLLMWIDSTGKWVEITYTSTSTTTSSTSSSSSSTSSTSSSSSSTSTTTT